MKKPVLISILFITIALFSAVYLFSITKDVANSDHLSQSKKKSPNKSATSLKSKTQTLKDKQKKDQSTLKDRRYSKKRSKWKDATDYPHADRLTKYFKRFHRRAPFSLSRKTPTVDLKIGKLFKKTQRDKTFNIREVLVSINTKTNPKTFVALVNEDTGKIIHRQGRRINEFRNKRNKSKRLRPN